MTAVLRRARPWVLALASGALLSLLYAPVGWPLLGWVAVTPLLRALDGATPRRGLALGWLCGTTGGLGVTGWWIGSAAFHYFGLSVVSAALFTFAVIQIFVSPAFALFGLLSTRLLRRRGAVLSLPAAFVACEYARAHLLGGNPWALLGQSQTSLLLLQLCDLTGVYGLSFLLALSAHSVASWQRTRLPLLATLALAAAALLYGQWRIVQIDAQDSTALQVALVQGNLDNSERGRPQHFETHLQRYLELTGSAAVPPPDLIVWPEQALGFFPEDNSPLTNLLAAALRGSDALLLTGAPRSVSSDGVAVLYNSAYLVGGAGLVDAYDKRILLPFVERLPLRPQDGPYQSGQRSGLFEVQGQTIGVLICYEAIYPELARRLRQGGAKWLVNISNDSWFDAGGGPQQHFQAVRLRAIEQRMSLVRVTNSGISAVIDVAGREIASLPSDAAVATSVRVGSTPLVSPYSLYGDAFAVACIVATVARLVWWLATGLSRAR